MNPNTEKIHRSIDAPMAFWSRLSALTKADDFRRSPVARKAMEIGLEVLDGKARIVKEPVHASPPKRFDFR